MAQARSNGTGSLAHSRRAPLPPTPCLAVDRDVLDRNISRLANFAAGAGLTLRPHVKTHKCPQIAHRQLAAGAVGICVATIGEAEVFVDAGFTDVFIAYPIWVDSARARRLLALAERARIQIGADSHEGVEALARRLGASRGAVEVLVEIDSGHHRTGCAPGQAGEIAAAAQRAGLSVQGVFTFPGHGYRPGAADQAARDESLALRLAAASFDATGQRCDVRSGGSSPTATLSDNSALTEIRPGVYVFGDAQQLELGRCEYSDLALTALATVVSRRRNHIVLDAGSKILGADRPDWTTGFGRLADYLEARVIALSEHHATVEFPDSVALPELGSVLRVVPNHVCAAVNLVDELNVFADSECIDQWPVCARGANS
ncbi:MAG: alanine racemase [Pseudonocardia sp.]|nr:alanine racemase [Pseudonocardia sp.]